MDETEEKKEEIKEPEKKETTMDTTKAEQAPEKTEDLSGLVNEFVAELPEDMQVIIPDSLSPVEKIKLARGLIKTAVKKAALQDGPGSETPGKKTKPDYNSMTTSELLDAGLK